LIFVGKKSDNDTKTQILDAAEQAFADLGFDAASLRHIISVAGVNLAAVHYHFGSKDGLMRAVFDRRLGPLNCERLGLLDEIEKVAGRRKELPLEPVIEALIGPALRLARDPFKGGPEVMRLFGRTIAEPGEEIQKLLHDQFGGVADRFGRALSRACPKLPVAVLHWRLHFTIGAMGHVMCDPTRMKDFTGGMCDPGDTDEVIRQMTAFLAAGFRAPHERQKGGRVLKVLAAGLLGIAAIACKAPKPDLSASVAPEGWASPSVEGSPDTLWWQGFGDAKLNRLIEEALIANRDIKAMGARVEAAFEQSNIVGAARLPEIDASLAGGRQQQVFVGLPIPGAVGPLKTRFSSRSMNLVANWELDLWGRVRSSRKAALADYLAATDDLQGARLSLAARVALAWVGVIEAEGQLALAREGALNRGAEVEVIRNRFQNGLRSSADLRAAISAEAVANAEVKARESQLKSAGRQLEILLGRYPAGLIDGDAKLPDLKDRVPAGLPSELLDRRPDLQAAQWRLQSSGLRVKEARASLLPRLSLTVSGGRSSSDLTDLLDSNFSVWSLAANAAQPLFQGGRLRSNVRLGKARFKEAAAAFESAVLAAFREVETALTNEEALGGREREIASALEQTEAVAALAEQRYVEGLGERVTSLEAVRRLLETRGQLLSIRRARLDNRIALHLALGGGFETNSQSNDSRK
jgi:multidrug efflux system outer membrane protein